ncbi:MAG: NAD(P)H-dependent oxidoreductase, partial [Nannocystaceae bacterium]|nr:NAD(P)H-dependent oxidoreductase [Nannocystaceae bacterium]
MNIVGISGSLRRGSHNSGLLRAASELVPSGVTLTQLSVAMPLYDGDLDDGGGPASVTEFKRAVAAADAVLIATPEYNYGIPGPLKNALDWASRPAYRSVFAGKKVALMGAAASVVGTARAQAHLKLVLLGMVAEVFPHPELLVGGSRTCLLYT